jgi:HSP20 family protein
MPNIGNYGNRPAVDIKETDKGYEVDAELPGMDESKVQVNVEGRTLTIESKDQGEKNVSPDKDKGDKDKAKPADRYLLRERYQYNFSRSFQLPEDADLDTIKAQFKDGLLELDIAKKPTSQKKAITITKA